MNIVQNIKTGLIYLEIEGKKKQLYNDVWGYFVYSNKKIGLVDRIDKEEDIKKIEDFLK
jgi:hypothetical protein